MVASRGSRNSTLAPTGNDAEVLIEEARCRQQRRRRWIGLSLLVAVVAGAAAYVGVNAGGGGRAHTVPTTRNSHSPSVGPVVNSTAFRGHGDLAFISRGSLWLLNGATGSLQALPMAAGAPAQPAFSADGRWLSYQTSSSSGASRLQWIAHADGSDAHSTRLRDATVIGWSPRGHRLAEAVPVRGSNMTALQILDPAGRSRTVARVRGFWSGTWSPDGRQLAVTTTGNVTGTTQLLTFPINGGSSRTWLSRDFRRSRLNGMTQPLLKLAGWWPHQGIAFWVVGDGMVSNNDQAPLDLVKDQNAKPRLLGHTLSGASGTTVTGSSRGFLALVDNAPRAFGRLIWQGKHVLVCAMADRTCARVPTPNGTVSIDPSWSPDGRTLALVQAPQRRSPAFPQQVVADWYGAHRLLLYDAVRRTARDIRAPGASAPVWSADGHSLLYAARDALWLLPSPTATPVRIATPIFPLNDWGAYYGQVRWSSQFTWSSH